MVRVVSSWLSAPWRDLSSERGSDRVLSTRLTLLALSVIGEHCAAAGVRSSGGIVMRRWAISLCAAIFSLGLLAAAPETAGASHNCVTRGELLRVTRGMTIFRVHRIFDTRGVFLDREATGRRVDVWRGYPLCWTARRAAVLNFDNYTDPRHGLRMFSKTRVLL